MFIFGDHFDYSLLLCFHNSSVSHKSNEGLKIIVATSVTFAVGVTVALIVSIYLGPSVVCTLCDSPRPKSTMAMASCFFII